MNYLIHTNVISELVKTSPNHTVINWLEQIPEHALYISVLTIGAIRKEIENIGDKNRKKKLIQWLDNDLSERFSERILTITQEVADRWGRLQAQVKRTLPAIDSLLAATALYYDMTLVTRNVNDFINCFPLETINPWENGQ